MSSKKRLAYLPLFVRDFLTDPNVLRMRWIDQAIYLRMLMASWEAGPLPDDDEMIVRMIGAQGLAHEVPAVVEGGEVDLREARFDVHGAVRAVLEDVWTLGASGWTSPRLEREREHGLALTAERSEHGLRGAVGRWGNARAMPEHSPSNGKPMPSQAQAQVQDQEKKNQSREENPSPAAPAPGQSPGRKPRKRKPVWAGSIPPELDSEPFVEEWSLWCRYRADEKGAPVTQLSGDALLAELVPLGPIEAARRLKQARANGWRGCDSAWFEKEGRNGTKTNGRHPTLDEKNRASLARMTDWAENPT